MSASINKHIIDDLGDKLLQFFFENPPNTINPNIETKSDSKQKEESNVGNVSAFTFITNEYHSKFMNNLINDNDFETLQSYLKQNPHLLWLNMKVGMSDDVLPILYKLFDRRSVLSKQTDKSKELKALNELIVWAQDEMLRAIIMGERPEEERYYFNLIRDENLRKPKEDNVLISRYQRTISSLQGLKDPNCRFLNDDVSFEKLQGYTLHNGRVLPSVLENYVEALGNNRSVQRLNLSGANISLLLERIFPQNQTIYTLYFGEGCQFSKKDENMLPTFCAPKTKVTHLHFNNDDCSDTLLPLICNSTEIRALQLSKGHNLNLNSLESINSNNTLSELQITLYPEAIPPFLTAALKVMGGLRILNLQWCAVVPMDADIDSDVRKKLQCAINGFVKSHNRLEELTLSPQGYGENRTMQFFEDHGIWNTLEEIEPFFHAMQENESIHTLTFHMPNRVGYDTHIRDIKHLGLLLTFYRELKTLLDINYRLSKLFFLPYTEERGRSPDDFMHVACKLVGNPLIQQMVSFAQEDLQLKEAVENVCLSLRYNDRARPILALVTKAQGVGDAKRTQDEKQSQYVNEAFERVQVSITNQFLTYKAFIALGKELNKKLSNKHYAISAFERVPEEAFSEFVEAQEWLATLKLTEEDTKQSLDSEEDGDNTCFLNALAHYNNIFEADDRLRRDIKLKGRAVLEADSKEVSADYKASKEAKKAKEAITAITYTPLSDKERDRLQKEKASLTNKFLLGNRVGSKDAVPMVEASGLGGPSTQSERQLLIKMRELIMKSQALSSSRS